MSERASAEDVHCHYYVNAPAPLCMVETHTPDASFFFLDPMREVHSHIFRRFILRMIDLMLFIPVRTGLRAFFLASAMEMHVPFHFHHRTCI